MKVRPTVIFIVLFGLILIAAIILVGNSQNRFKKIIGVSLVNDSGSSYQTVKTNWPLPKINNSESYLFRCVTSRKNFHFGVVEIGTNFLLKSWAECYYLDQMNKVNYLEIPLYVQNNSTKDVFVTFAVEPSKTLSDGFTPQALSKMFAGNKIFSNVDMNKPVTVSVVFGPPSTKELGYSTMFDQYLREIDLNKIIEFSKSGDVNELENISGVGRYLPAYKINLDILR